MIIYMWKFAEAVLQGKGF